MRIFIELPTWLGDAIMASVAINNLFKKFPDAKFTVFGSYVATEIYKPFDQVEKILIDSSKQKNNRYIWLYKEAKDLGKFDLSFSFRHSFSSKFLIFFISSAKKYIYKRLSKEPMHQVKRYNDFVAHYLGCEFELDDLSLPFKQKISDRPLLGINPGATYGNAKRWYPSEFAKVAIALSNKFDILIFGGPTETEIAGDIADILKKNGIKNFTNLAGKTTIPLLCEYISSLSLFVTNDSGPLHIAAAYKIKTIAIFGPTIPKETNGWRNDNEIIVRKHLKCQPCMKRICPLDHHECMKQILASDVLKVLE